MKVDQLLETDIVGYKQLKEFVYNSQKFFVDRISLLEDEQTAKKIKMRHVIKSDKEKLTALKEYLDSHDAAKMYVKKKF